MNPISTEHGKPQAESSGKAHDGREWVRRRRKRKRKGRAGGLKVMRRKKNKTIWAYLDGKKLVDVVQAALDNRMDKDAVKALLVRENPGHEVTFRVE